MARPTKRGLDYYPKDVNAKFDTKFKYVESQNGVIARFVLYELWDLIYREEGYFAKFDKIPRTLFIGDLPIDMDELNNILESCFEIQMFDETLYRNYEILTSVSIQKRYLEAIKRRSSIDVISEYILIDSDTQKNINAHINLVNVNLSNNNTVNVNINPRNVDIGTQSKVKESKVNKSKVKRTVEVNSTESDFNKLWLLYPRKEGRKTALAAYKRAIKKGATNKLIQNGIVQYSKHIEVKNTDKQYIKTGATFFSQEAWNDEFDMTPGQAHSFGKVTKKESLPDWAKDDYEPPEETSTVDKVALQKQLDEFNKTSPKEN